MGAAGVATAKILLASGMKNLTLVDIHGVIRADDNDYNEYQRELATAVNQVDGQSLDDVIDNQDVFIGLSDANVLSKEQVARMAQDAIVFALANPVPEILPEEAHEGGAAITATGSSQWAHQVNNVLVFPGLSKGLLATDIKKVELSLQVKLAEGLAQMITTPTADHIVPRVFDDGVVDAVSNAVIAYAKV